MPLILIWQLLISVAYGQLCLPGPKDLTKFIQSGCNSTFAAANATGYYSFNPDVPQAYQVDEPDNLTNHTANVTWATTLSILDETIQTISWISTGGANYTDDLSLVYDVCYLQLNGLTHQSLYKGQNDDGTCSSILSNDCITALTDLATDTATGLTDNPTLGPKSNLTGNVLGICDKIGNVIRENFPSKCQSYFTTSQQVLDGLPVDYAEALTDFNNTNPDGTCVDNREYGCSSRGDGGKTFWAVNGFIVPIEGKNQTYINTNYDYVSWQIFPTLLTWMPAASYLRNTAITTKSYLSCLHVDNFNPGSRVAQSPPISWKPKHHGLTGGDIAGIVVGSVFGAIIVAAVVFWIVRRRRQSNNAKAAGPSELEGDGAESGHRKEMAADKESPTAPTFPTNELSPEAETKHELSHEAEAKHELPSPEYELPGSQPPQEMWADPPEMPTTAMERDGKEAGEDRSEAIVQGRTGTDDTVHQNISSDRVA